MFLFHPVRLGTRTEHLAASLWDFEEVQQLALRPMVASAAAY